MYLVFGVATKIIEVEGGWKKFILICHEAVFLKIFRDYITRYSSVDRWYRCVFKGMMGKENLNECLGH